MILKMIQKVDNLQKNHRQYNTESRINGTLEFNRVLQNVQKSNELKMSAHAENRLKERNINLTQADIKNINEAAEKIRNKGGREALILYKDIAFVASIRNNTIITAVDSSNLKENVFTNIDSAVII